MASRYSSRCSRFSKRIQPSSVSASTVPSDRMRAGLAADHAFLDDIELAFPGYLASDLVSGSCRLPRLLQQATTASAVDFAGSAQRRGGCSGGWFRLGIKGLLRFSGGPVPAPGWFPSPARRPRSPRLRPQWRRLPPVRPLLSRLRRCGGRIPESRPMAALMAG